MGVVNLVYAAYSGTLAKKTRGGQEIGQGWVIFLIAANGAWGVLCFVMALSVWGSVGVLGLVHLCVEGAFVGGLAVVERKILRAHQRLS